jgi:hypothetical protein
MNRFTLINCWARLILSPEVVKRIADAEGDKGVKQIRTVSMQPELPQLSIYGLFNDAINSSEYIASNDKATDE